MIIRIWMTLAVISHTISDSPEGLWVINFILEAALLRSDGEETQKKPSTEPIT